MWGHSPCGEAMVTVAEWDRQGPFRGLGAMYCLLAPWVLWLDTGGRPALVAKDGLVQLASLSAPLALTQGCVSLSNCLVMLPGLWGCRVSEALGLGEQALGLGDAEQSTPSLRPARSDSSQAGSSDWVSSCSGNAGRSPPSSVLLALGAMLSCHYCSALPCG